MGNLLSSDIPNGLSSDDMNFQSSLPYNLKRYMVKAEKEGLVNGYLFLRYEYVLKSMLHI